METAVESVRKTALASC